METRLSKAQNLLLIENDTDRVVAIIKCKNCFPQKGCWAQERAKIYGVDEFGEIQGEQNMMNEILQRGPITCAIAVTT